MFRGKQAMNGEGQTGGGSPFNHLDVAVEEQNRTAKARRHGGRRSQDDERSMKMATKTTNIEVKVDEALASAIADKAVKTWHATSYSNGRKRVYVTFEEVKTVGA